MITITLVIVVSVLLLCLLYLNFRDWGKEKFTSSDKLKYVKNIRNNFLNYLNNDIPQNKTQPWENDVTICVKTFNRPSCLFRLVKSIRDLYKTVKIIIIDDSQYPVLDSGSYNPNIEVVVLDKFVGVSGRNEGLIRTTTKYFMLVDDDMYLIPQTDIWSMWNFLNKNPRFTLISGRLSDRGDFNGIYEINDEMKTVTTKSGQIIRKINETVSEVHRAHNFFMTRTEKLLDVKWDSNILTAEHEEHFYRMFLAGFVVADDSSIIIGHDKGLGCDDKIFSYNAYREASRFPSYILHKHHLTKFDDMSIEEKQKQFSSVLNNINTSIGVKFHLFHGTALGIMKTRQFLNDSQDIDIAIFQSDLNKIGLDQVIENINLSNVSNYDNILVKGKKDNIHVSITIINEEEFFNWFVTLFGEDQKLQKWKLPKYDTPVINSFGSPYYIIPIHIFPSLYGNNWQYVNTQDLPWLMYNNKIGFKWHDDSEFNNDGPVPVITDNFVNEFFRDNIWIVNLNSRPDKLQQSMEQLNRIGIKAKRFEAVDGKTDPEALLEFSKSDTILNTGEIGCALSHKILWENIVENKIPWTLIFEDDIIIPSNVTQRTFGEVMVESTTGWRNPQIVYFGYQYDDYVNNLGEINPEHDILVGSTQTCSTYAYAITWRGAQKLLDTLHVWDKPIDLKMKYDFCGNDKCFAAIQKSISIIPNTSGKGIVFHREEEGVSDIGTHTWIPDLDKNK